jgi:predicted permease
MSNFIMLIVCLLAGILMRQRKLVPDNAYKGLNAWVIYIAMPAVVLRYVPAIEWSADYLLLIIGPAICWAGAAIFVKAYSRFNPIDQATKTAMLVTSALANTAFMGFPMVTAFYGAELLPVAVVFDQVTFFFLSLFGIVSIMKASAAGDNAHIYRTAIMKTLHFPPFIACVVALILPIFIDISPANELLALLVATVAPMSIFSIGLQLRLKDGRSELKNITAALGYRLFIAPLLMVIAALVMGVSGNQAKIAVMEASMPSNVTISLMAAEYGLNPNFCALMVGVGVILSFLTIVLWWAIAGLIF